MEERDTREERHKDWRGEREDGEIKGREGEKS